MTALSTDKNAFNYTKKAGIPRCSIVFIHGSGCNHTVWNFQIKELPSDFNAVTIDLPAHGKSMDSACSSIEEMSRFVKHLIDELNLPHPLFLVGHSLGAAITLYFARYYQDFLDGLIVIGGGAKLRVIPDILNRLSQGEINPQFIHAAFGPSAPDELVKSQEHIFLSNQPEVLYRDLNSCNNFDLSKELTFIHKPVLIIVGSMDRLTPVKHSIFLENNLPNSTLNIIENAGHMVMLEKPTEVTRLIVEFITKHI